MKRNVPAPKKRLGQNFLQSPYYAKCIASAVDSPDDSKVIEIGPGRGALSIFLKERFPRFHLIEKDRDLIPFLNEKLGDGEWTLHICNVLDFNFESIGPPLHIVGNLPYNIAAFIIRKTLLNVPQVASVTYMVQREVAERIVAKPHTKQIGFLSIFCQFFGKPKILFRVPNGAFYPIPKVESAVFQLNIDKQVEEGLPRKKWEEFFRFVSNSYTTRRKTLVTSLARKRNKKDYYASIIEEIGLDRKVRPEDLNVREWLELYSSLEDKA